MSSGKFVLPGEYSLILSTRSAPPPSRDMDRLGGRPRKGSGGDRREAGAPGGPCRSAGSALASSEGSRDSSAARPFALSVARSVEPVQGEVRACRGASIAETHSRCCAVPPALHEDPALRQETRRLPRKLGSRLPTHLGPAPRSAGSSTSPGQGVGEVLGFLQDDGGSWDSGEWSHAASARLRGS